MDDKILGVDILRRDVLKGTGGLVVGFALAGCGMAETVSGASESRLGPYGPPADEIDSWIAIAEDGTATLFTGCCELGTGSWTGLLQIMAEELDIAFADARLHGPDTSHTPDQFVSSGSRTISIHSKPIRHAAAHARHALVRMAADHLGVSADRLEVNEGIVSVVGDPGQSVGYGDLIGGKLFNMKITDATDGESVGWYGDDATAASNGTPSRQTMVRPKDPSQYKIVGTPVQRIDIPDKVFGTFAYMQDVKLPGMLHGRVVRPPAHGASVIEIDEGSVANIPGLVKVVRVHDFVGVVCEREEQAISAAQALDVTWSDWAGLPDMADLNSVIRNAPEMPDGYSSRPDRPPRPGGIIANEGDVEGGLSNAVRTVEASYTTPYHSHGSIGPSCAVADVRPEGTTVWSGTQTPYGLRESCAKFLGVENNMVRLIYVEASGCYGQNGADDVTLDAIIMSRDVGRPVRVQWMRADEHGWETYKSARVYDCRGGVDADGNIVAWETLTRGFTGYSRPQYHEPAHGGEPGSLVSAKLAGWTEPGLEEGFGGAAGNFLPVYQNIPNKLIQFTYLGATSHRDGSLNIRTGSMRGVGSPDNIFVVESLMDELAAAAGADALEFRLRHAPTERMRRVFEAAAERANWQARPSHSRPNEGDIAYGRGIAALGSPVDTNVVGIFEVAVNRLNGQVHLQRAVVAQDCGLVVNPDTVTDQLEAGVIQNLSRVLKEEVTFDHSRVTSLDWVSYPIMTFPEIPDAVEVVLLDRPNEPPGRVGEPASEVVWPAVANAIYDAVGVRMRDMPFRPERILAALQDQA
jgi:CO/xanthine dehydrogenase Mo-binding subunit